MYKLKYNKAWDRNERTYEKFMFSEILLILLNIKIVRLFLWFGCILVI